ncbi:MAG TPA: energy-coupling factor ABC transporter permease [Candidatus Aquicultor sp.]|jgi:cobalt/nickel transport system permease protein
MSHIHLPDGVIPVVWWVLGYIIVGILLAFAFKRTQSTEGRKRVPLLGIMSALMLIGQSVPLGIIPFHLNLAVLSGIVLGPWLGLIAVFTTNIFLAFLGHGGITVVGLNTLVVGSEAVFGSLLFRFFSAHFSSVRATAVVTTVLTLSISISLMVGVVSLSQINPSLLLEHVKPSAATGAIVISIPRFVGIIAPFAVIGIIIESFVTAFAIRFLLSVRPDIVES